MPNAPPPASSNATLAARQRQPQRIFGVLPNYNVVSAGTIPPPPGPRRSFTIATRTSFDYPAVIAVGFSSLLAEADNRHPQLGKGPAGFGRYYWRGFADKTDGNYMVMWVFPSILHEDERYFALGQGSMLRRSLYAASSVIQARTYAGATTFNFSEILGRGTAQAISLAYYPSTDQTASAFAEKYALALGRDAITNGIREFGPDISRHVLHSHSKPSP